MPVQIGSRYQPCYQITDEQGNQYLSRRPRMIMDADPTDLTYTTVVGDNLWKIAGREEIYNDPTFWWVLADYNSMGNVFSATFSQLDPGTILAIPTMDRVKKFLNGTS